jgi:hypothetical protein
LDRRSFGSGLTRGEWRILSPVSLKLIAGLTHSIAVIILLLVVARACRSSLLNAGWRLTRKTALVNLNGSSRSFVAEASQVPPV